MVSTLLDPGLDRCGQPLFQAENASISRVKVVIVIGSTIGIDSNLNQIKQKFDWDLPKIA